MATSEAWKNQIRQGAYDSVFCGLYGKNPETTARQRARYLAALEGFEYFFGKGRGVTIYSAPGRTEIGGNHTDHNNGIVMAAAVDLDIIAVVGKTDTGIARVKSQGFQKMDSIDLSVLQPVNSEREHSAAMIRGVAAGFLARGGKIGGFDAYTTSQVLRGSGLSSSAAFEVCMGTIFRGEYNGGDQTKFPQLELARIGQYAENVFFGKPSGLMDQTACAVGGAVKIDFRSPEQPIVSSVPLDLTQQGYALCISDTKGSHADLTEDYAAIRAEMESVAHYFNKPVLREVEEDTFFAAIPEIRKVLGDRAVMRAIHFFSECHRAEALCEAVRNGKFEEFLSLVLAGGHSSFEYNQNAYSIRQPQEQGVPLGLALSQRVLEGRGAWRLQGGGFGGTIQAFVPLTLLPVYQNTIESVFGKGSCYVLCVRNYGAVAVTQELCAAR
jgi:galactokinase